MRIGWIVAAAVVVMVCLACDAILSLVYYRDEDER